MTTDTETPTDPHTPATSAETGPGRDGGPNTGTSDTRVIPGPQGGSTATETLAAWRAVTEGATEGPWRVGTEGSEGSRVNPDTGDKRADVRAILVCNGRVQPEDGRNAAFIATARDAMPRLLTFAEAVLALHAPFEWSFGYGPVESCRECARLGASEAEAAWPCPTVVLAEHLGGEGL